MLYFHRTPKAVQWLYPGLVWHMDRSDKQVYLTFDDGPVPGMTPEILEILREKKVHATFFCVGDNIRKYPHILEQVVEEGHAIGNHTFHHLNGWSSPPGTYVDDVLECDRILARRNIETKLFRPPYGRISRRQIKKMGVNKKIIMWDVLTGDFDQQLTWRACLERTIPHIRPGSIIVMHDNTKAKERTLRLLPELIDHLADKQLKCSLFPY